MAKGSAIKRIMIVEDDESTQEIYRDIFDKERGYFVNIVDTAESALKALRADAYDLVLLDIIMEPMAGDSFLIYLRKDPRTANIPVIVVSVLGEEILKALRKIDRVKILQKPITKEVLFKKITQALK